MKKLFYTSIFILCILVWLNIHNKEGINETEPETVFKGLSVDRFRDVLDILDGMSSQTKKVPVAIPNVVKSNVVVKAASKQISAGVSTFNSVKDSQTDEVEAKPVKTITQRVCPTTKDVIEKLRSLQIDDDEFNKIIDNPNDPENTDRAYAELINKLKRLPVVPHICKYRKRKHKTHQYFPNNVCKPKCKCIKDPNICKNYSYLRSVLNRDETDFENIIPINNSYLYNPVGRPNIMANVTNEDDLKRGLKKFFGFTGVSD